MRKVAALRAAPHLRAKGGRGGGGGRAGGGKGFLIGALAFGFTIVDSAVSGSETPIDDALESIDFDPLPFVSTMGDGEYTLAEQEEDIYRRWRAYEDELDSRAAPPSAAQLALLRGGIDALARQGLRSGGSVSTPSSNPSRASRFPR